MKFKDNFILMQKCLKFEYVFHNKHFPQFFVVVVNTCKTPIACVGHTVLAYSIFYVFLYVYCLLHVGSN